MVERAFHSLPALIAGRHRKSVIWLCATVTLFALVLARTSDALVVGNFSGTIADTTVNPVNFSGWTHGDPGWANFSTGGSYVYLGDGWVLSARHVGNNVPIQFQTPSGPVTFPRIPGNYYRDYGYLWTNGEYYHAVENPSSVQLENGSTVSLTQFTDLQLFRINGDPGLPSLTISSQPLPSDFTRNQAPQVVFVGGGNGRLSNQTQWNVNQISDDNWIWSQTTGVGHYQGFFAEGATEKKRWGTNRVADPRPNGPGDPSDIGAMDYSSIFDKGVISDTTGVHHFQTGDGVFRDVIGSLTVYDQAGQPGTPAYGVNNLEVQGVPGDSGSAVFYKRGNQWELAGIVNATFTYTDQPNAAVYGNATMYTDLSKYNQNYFHSIQNIIATHADYSISGDVNLDGVVSGNGTGPASTDDVSAFVAGWNYNNSLSTGTITSWKNGDLTRDGRTNVADFLRLRSALNGQISSAVVAALFGNNAIPEPSAAMLLLLAASQLILTRRPR